MSKLEEKIYDFLDLCRCRVLLTYTPNGFYIKCKDDKQGLAIIDLLSPLSFVDLCITKDQVEVTHAWVGVFFIYLRFSSDTRVTLLSVGSRPELDCAIVDANEVINFLETTMETYIKVETQDFSPVERLMLGNLL